MATTSERTIEVCGFKVLVVSYPSQRRSFYYPSFNGNAEFPVTSKGFRRLSSYLRFFHHVDELMKIPSHGN